LDAKPSGNRFIRPRPHDAIGTHQPDTGQLILGNVRQPSVFDHHHGPTGRPAIMDQLTTQKQWINKRFNGCVGPVTIQNCSVGSLKLKVDGRILRGVEQRFTRQSNRMTHVV